MCFPNLRNKKRRKELTFSLRTYACISSWEAYTQHGEESTSYKFIIQILKKHQDKASLRTEMAQDYRQRVPVLGLIINTKVQSKAKEWEVCKCPF